MLAKIQETVSHIQQKINFTPEIGIILGTGLGNLGSQINIEHELLYTDIPNFPVSTVKGHSGKLLFGTFGSKKVVAMQGRFHYYEGYTMQEVVFPIRVMKLLGINLLILSNAAGGMNPEFEVGDIMLIKDHINCMGTNPLIGKNIDELGPRFPDMMEAYDKTLIEKAESIGKAHNIHLQKGVYVGVSGPTFETPAEYHYFRKIGGDCVGMSTVPETIAARHMGLKVFAISVVTDLGVEGKFTEISHEEVIKAANASEPKMTLIISNLIESL